MCVLLLDTLYFNRQIRMFESVELHTRANVQFSLWFLRSMFFLGSDHRDASLSKRVGPQKLHTSLCVNPPLRRSFFWLLCSDHCKCHIQRGSPHAPASNQNIKVLPSGMDEILLDIMRDLREIPSGLLSTVGDPPLGSQSLHTFSPLFLLSPL